MSEITRVFIDECKEFTRADWDRLAVDGVITPDTIRDAKRMLAQKGILPLKIRGHEFYIFPVGGDCRALREAMTRQDWYDYYRAQRVLRSLLMRNRQQYDRFGRAFQPIMYADLRREYPDGRFGMEGMPLSVRLHWHKLRNKR